MLKDVLHFFIDYGVKINTEKTKEEKELQLKEIKRSFGEEASSLMTLLLERLEEGKDVMLDYAQETGASFNNAQPDFKSILTEHDLFSALKLIIKYGDDIEISATHNGLGYNNLVYMSLLLSKMQADADGGYMGDNAKVFPILAIEEPESSILSIELQELTLFLYSANSFADYEFCLRGVKFTYEHRKLICILLCSISFSSFLIRI